MDVVGEDGLLIFKAATADRSVEEFVVVFDCELFSSLLDVSLAEVTFLVAAAANLSLSAGDNVVDGILSVIW